MRVAGLSLLLAVCPPAVDVRSTGPGQVRLTVKAVPLADVLECVSQKTGVKVVYDGLAAPRQLVSAVVPAGTVAEAVDKLFEGQGLNYALGVDRDGKGLLVVSSSAPAPRAPLPASTTRREAEVQEEPEEVEVPEEVFEEPPQIELAPAPTVPVFPGMVPGVPGQPGMRAGPPGVPPGMPAPIYPEPDVLSRSTYP